MSDNKLMINIHAFVGMYGKMIGRPCICNWYEDDKEFGNENLFTRHLEVWSEGERLFYVKTKKATPSQGRDAFDEIFLNDVMENLFCHVIVKNGGKVRKEVLEPTWAREEGREGADA
jgi:hypothetical protein